MGKLLYLSVCTHPDIAYAVGALSRYMAKPSEQHMQVAKGVLRYLAGTAVRGLTFGPGNTVLQGYCDADYAGDLSTRRSTTGYVFLINDGAVSLSSRLQQTVAVSTTEAEYMAAGAAVKEALHLRLLQRDTGHAFGPTMIRADNQGAIKLLRNPIASEYSKHIDVLHHFAREHVARRAVAFDYVSTAAMVADVLTKALPEAKFSFCAAGLVMR